MKDDAVICQLTSRLLDAGVYTASAKMRVDLATTIVTEFGRAPTEEELVKLRKKAEKGRSPSGLLTHWLKSGHWLTLLKPEPGAANSGLSNNVYVPPPGFEEEVETHRVVCIALGDRKPAEEVARLCGITKEQVEKIVDTAGRNVFGDRAADLWLGLISPPPFVRKPKVQPLKLTVRDL